MGRAADLDYNALIRLVVESALAAQRTTPALDPQVWALTQRLSGVSGG